MANKSFKGLLSKNQEDKKSINLESENQRLREKILELKSSQNSNISLVKLSDIHLRQNIRDDEFDYNYEDITSLANDIEINGQLSPILISKDNYLLAGYRRYYSVKLLSENNRAIGEIIAYTYPKLSEEIDDEELLDIQFSENNERRNIDNFQLSHLYNELLIKNSEYDQNKLAEKFKKTKSFISMVLSIQKIDINLVKLIKQFQIYGWSQQKFNMLNFQENQDEKLLKEFEKLRGIVGITKLTGIAKKDNIEEQKKTFLKIFSNRLTPEELKSDYFKDFILDTKKENSFNEKSLKQIKSLEDILDKDTDSTFKESKDYQLLKIKIEELKKLLSKVNVE